MLDSFTIKRRFNKLAVSIYVDCGRKEAALTVSYDRRLLRVGYPLPFHETDTPAKAEAWLSAPAVAYHGEYGSRLETLEWQARTGALQPETAA